MVTSMNKKQALPLILSGLIAIGATSNVFAADATQAQPSEIKAPIDTIFEQGEVNPYGKFFTGRSYLAMLSENDTVFNAPIGNVTFEPGTRTNWHKHTGGQILLVTSGEGRYQERGKPAQTIKKGDVVRIAPNVEHWHGASAKTWMTHISVETNVPNNKSEWLEAVDDKTFAEAQ